MYFSLFAKKAFFARAPFFVAAVFLLFSVNTLSQNPTPTPSASPTPAVSPIPSGTPLIVNDPPPVATTFEAPTRPMPSTERVGLDNANQLSLTLNDAIELALKNNNDIDASRNTARVSDFNLMGARGVYDPLITSDAYYESLTTPTASAIGGAVNGAVTQKRLFGSAGVNGFSPWGGGSYSALYNTSRTTTSNTNSFLNPQFPTSLALSYTQPLLRNFRFDQNRRQIEIAKRNIELTDSQLKQKAMDVIAGVESAYWDLVYALRNLQVQIDALKQAREQLASNERQVAKGVLAPIEIVAATAQISTFEQNIYTAQETVTRAENALKTLMLPDRTAAEWRRPITPVTPVTLEPPRIGLEVAVDEALKNRPELAQLEVNAEINRIDQRYYKDQTKPQIDIVGSFTPQGLAGSETPAAINPATGVSRVPPNLVGGFFSSLGNLAALDYPSYRIGVSIAIPWGNHVAKANLGSSIVQGERIQNLRAQQEQTIEAEVRNALQALRSGESRLNSAAAARAAAEQLYESEQRLFRGGTSSVYLVLQRQTELIAARGRELQAQTDLNKAISDFNRAIGKTLDVNNVTVSR